MKKVMMAPFLQKWCSLLAQIKKQELGKQACRNSEIISRHSLGSVFEMKTKASGLTVARSSHILSLCDQNSFPGDTASRQHLNYCRLSYE